MVAKLRNKYDAFKDWFEKEGMEYCLRDNTYRIREGKEVFEIFEREYAKKQKELKIKGDIRQVLAKNMYKTIYFDANRFDEVVDEIYDVLMGEGHLNELK